jgi:hypothetical protein
MSTIVTILSSDNPAASVADLNTNFSNLNTDKSEKNVVVVTSGNVNAASAPGTNYTYKVAGLHTVTLPTAVGNTNQYDIINLHSANNSIATTSSQTIHGTAAPITIVPNQALTLQSDGTNWIIK